VEVVPFVQHLDIRMAGDARPLGGGTEPVVAPTADFAVHFADGLATADLGDWTLIRTQVEQASSGWMVDSIRLWRPDGALLATARQTRRILAPR
jgi:acyl-CoA thioesterase